MRCLARSPSGCTSQQRHPVADSTSIRHLRSCQASSIIALLLFVFLSGLACVVSREARLACLARSQIGFFREERDGLVSRAARSLLLFLSVRACRPCFVDWLVSRGARLACFARSQMVLPREDRDWRVPRGARMPCCMLSGEFCLSYVEREAAPLLFCHNDRSMLRGAVRDVGPRAFGSKPIRGFRPLIVP